MKYKITIFIMDDDIVYNNIGNLPVDILVLIFARIHGGQVLRCGAVCKRWREAADMDWLWAIILSRELEYGLKCSIKQNIITNKEVALLWRKKYQKSLKTIYVEDHRKIKKTKEGNPKPRVFPKILL